MSLIPAPPLSPFKTAGLRWEVTKDEVETCRYEVLKYKHMKRHDYFPGIESTVLPSCYAEIISQTEWERKIDKINQAILKWWYPGNRVRNASYLVGTVFLLVPCLVLYCALDEVGYFCFVNRKRKQLRDLLKPICESLSDEKLKWCVEYKRRPGDEAKGPDNEQAENSKAVYIAISRQDQAPAQGIMAIDRAKTPPDTSRVSDEDSERAWRNEIPVGRGSSASSVGARSKNSTPKHSIHPETEQESTWDNSFKEGLNLEQSRWGDRPLDNSSDGVMSNLGGKFSTPIYTVDTDPTLGEKSEAPKTIRAFDNVPIAQPDDRSLVDKPSLVDHDFRTPTPEISTDTKLNLERELRVNDYVEDHRAAQRSVSQLDGAPGSAEEGERPAEDRPGEDDVSVIDGVLGDVDSAENGVAASLDGAVEMQAVREKATVNEEYVPAEDPGNILKMLEDVMRSARNPDEPIVDTAAEEADATDYFAMIDDDNAYEYRAFPNENIDVIRFANDDLEESSIPLVRSGQGASPVDHGALPFLRSSQQLADLLTESLSAENERIPVKSDSVPLRLASSDLSDLLGDGRENPERQPALETLSPVYHKPFNREDSLSDLQGKHVSNWPDSTSPVPSEAHRSNSGRSSLSPLHVSSGRQPTLDMSDILGGDWNDAVRQPRSKTDSAVGTPRVENKHILPEDATPLAQWSQKDYGNGLNTAGSDDYADWLNDINDLLADTNDVGRKEDNISPARVVLTSTGSPSAQNRVGRSLSPELTPFL